MSSLTLHVYVGNIDDVSSKTYGLLKNLEISDYSTIRKTNSKFFPDDLEFHFEWPISNKVLNESTVYFSFETRTSFPYLEFFDLKGDIDSATIEACIFNDQVGEFSYFKGGTHTDCYTDLTWQWLADPDEDPFDEKHVAVTGKFEHYSREEIEEIEEIVEEWGGIVQKSVNSKTVLLIVGTKPGASKINKARELSTKTMDEEEFSDAIGD